MAQAKIKKREKEGGREREREAEKGWAGRALFQDLTTPPSLPGTSSVWDPPTSALCSHGRHPGRNEWGTCSAHLRPDVRSRNRGRTLPLSPPPCTPNHLPLPLEPHLRAPPAPSPLAQPPPPHTPPAAPRCGGWPDHLCRGPRLARSHTGHLSPHLRGAVPLLSDADIPVQDGVLPALFYGDTVLGSGTRGSAGSLCLPCAQRQAEGAWSNRTLGVSSPDGRPWSSLGPPDP